MILYVKEDCKHCKAVKSYINMRKMDIEIRQLSEEAREILIAQNAKNMPLLVENGKLLKQGIQVLDFLVESESRKGKI